jgi:LDH2 family malate/lactate/ureidoglycolate dehydrogenase
MRSETTADGSRSSPDRLQAFCREIFERSGVPPDEATTVSACLVSAELGGVDSQGVVRLPVYARRIKTGVVNPRPKVRFISVSPSILRADGDNGLGPVVATAAMKKAIETAGAGSILNHVRFGYEDEGVPFVGS